LDIPLEEREEALKYYNGYFEDAGEDHEEEIIKELGTPKKVAAIIKADLNSNAEEREARGYFTEKGYEDTSYHDDKYEIVGAGKNKSKSNNSESSNPDNSNRTESRQNSYQYGQGKNKNQNENNRQGFGYQQNSYSQTSTGNQGTDPRQGYAQGKAGASRNTRNSNTGLILLIAIFTFPVWLPILLSVFGIVIGVVTTIIGLIFGFGAAGVALIGVGIALFIAGLVQISIPFFGILMIGGGLVVLGIGMLLTLACVLLCKKVLPALIRGVVNICRLPFKNRSVMA
jgi:uncharacterized membrane protein